MPCNIAMVDVCFGYETGDTVPLLRKASFSVNKGEVAIIGGKSGHGTSTLLELFVGLLKPNSGQVLWDNEDLAGFSFDELMRKRRTIGYVFQDCALISTFTAFDNIALPLRNQGDLSEQVVRKKVRSIMEEFILLNIDDRYPESLSEWQRKAVAVARALVNNPDMLFLDELTGGIDSGTATGILNVIEERLKTYAPAIIMISHDLTLWPHRRAHRMLLENGKLSPFEPVSGSDTTTAK